jgi:cell wall-associated protease
MVCRYGGPMKRYESPNKDFDTFVKVLVAFTLFYFLFNVAHAKQIKVAVIDTGINNAMLKTPARLCPEGHDDFTADKDPFLDNNGHGTHISGIIQAGAKKINYCQIILKFYSKNSNEPENHLYNTIKAFRKAIKLKVDVINYSSAGSDLSKNEVRVVKKALDAGIKVVVSAGNDGKPLELYPTYPGCSDSRIFVVAAKKRNGKRDLASNYSNKSKVNKCKGTMVEEFGTVTIPFSDGTTQMMRGSSQAAAIRTVKEILRSYYGKLKSK